MTKVLVMTEEQWNDSWLGVDISKWGLEKIRAAMTEVDLDEMRKDPNIQDVTGSDGTVYTDMRELRDAAIGYNWALDDLLIRIKEGQHGD